MSRFLLLSILALSIMLMSFSCGKKDEDPKPKKPFQMAPKLCNIWLLDMTSTGASGSDDNYWTKAPTGVSIQTSDSYLVRPVNQIEGDFYTRLEFSNLQIDSLNQGGVILNFSANNNLDQVGIHINPYFFKVDTGIDSKDLYDSDYTSLTLIEPLLSAGTLEVTRNGDMLYIKYQDVRGKTIEKTAEFISSATKPVFGVITGKSVHGEKFKHTTSAEFSRFYTKQGDQYPHDESFNCDYDAL